MNNRTYNAKNPYQGAFTRTLCVCSAGLLRSPTAAYVLAGEPFNCNTRAAGIESSYALVPVDDVLIYWAQQIVCMTHEHKQMLMTKFGPEVEEKILVLDVPDNFAYRDPTLVQMIKDSYTKLTQVNPS